MTSIRSTKQETGQFNHFEQVHQTSYSHGLEAIYKLETVDVKSIRLLAGQDFSPYEKDFGEPSISELPQDQLEFDFGDAYRESADSFVLMEPLCVLGLSRQAERCLLERGVRCLNDLLKVDLSVFVYYKGMGQGHIDEVRDKLKKYLDGQVIYKAPCIDFGAWLRSLVLPLCTKKMFVFLEPFHLTGLLTLSPAESVEVRRLSPENQIEWRHEIRNLLLKDRGLIEADIHKIMAVYIKPWMARRHGFATINELIDRMQRLARQPALVSLAMDFMAAVYFEGSFPLVKCLPSENEGLLFADSATLQKYTAVLEKAKTYFYKTGLAYDLSELVGLLSREFSVAWAGFAEGFIEKCLRASFHFRVRKDSSDRLTVRRF